MQDNPQRFSSDEPKIKKRYTHAVESQQFFRQLSYILLLLFVFLIPWRSLWVVAQNLTIANLVGMALAAVWGVSVLQQQSVRELRAFHLLLGLFVSWAVVSTVWSPSQLSGIVQSGKYVGYFVLSLIIWDLVRNREILERLMMMYVLGAGFLILLEWAFRPAPNYLGGFTAGPNAFAARIVFSLPMAWYLFRNAKAIPTYVRRIGMPAHALATVASIGVASSRAAFLAMAVALMFGPLLELVLGSRKSIQGQIAFAALAAGTLLITPVILPEFQRALQQLQTGLQTGNFGDRSIGTRLKLYYLSIQYLIVHPMGGAGADGFIHAILPGNPRGPHSGILKISVEHGLVGIGLFVGFVVAAIKGSFRAENRYLSVPLLSTWLVISLFSTIGAGIEGFVVLTITYLTTHTR